MTPNPEMVSKALILLTDGLGIGECTCAMTVESLGEGVLGVKVIIVPEDDTPEHDPAESEMARKVDALFDE